MFKRIRAAALVAAALASVGLTSVVSGVPSASAAEGPSGPIPGYGETAGALVVQQPHLAAAQQKVVYFTYDDGPNPVHTPQLLSLFRTYHGRATFFLIGSAAQENPWTVLSTRLQGHAVGNHTYTHPRIPDIPQSQLIDEIRRTDAVIGGSRCFRPPYGATTPETTAVVNSMRKSLDLWTIDTSDWSAPGTNAIVETVRTQVQNGSVVLMHDGVYTAPDETVAAMKILLPELQRQGYRFESLPTCR